jgi:hypothetical protein
MKSKRAKPDPAGAIARSCDDVLLHMAASMRAGGGGFLSLNVSPWMLLWSSLRMIKGASEAAGVTLKERNSRVVSLKGQARPFRTAIVGPSVSPQFVYELDLVEEASSGGARMLSSLGLARRDSGPLLRQTRYRFTPDGSHNAWSLIHCLCRGAKGLCWRPLAEPAEKNLLLANQDPAVSVAVILEGLARHVWTVTIRPEGCPVSLRLGTDAIGAREMLRFRDLPPGGSRRDAILHFVRAHERRKASDPEALTDIRRHLRGGREFRWYDLLVTVSESEQDREALTQAG